MLGNAVLMVEVTHMMQELTGRKMLSDKPLRIVYASSFRP
jgi:hypothetical protein